MSQSYKKLELAYKNKLSYNYVDCLSSKITIHADVVELVDTPS